MTFRNIWSFIRERFRCDADRRLAEALKDAPALDAHRLRQIRRVQNETLARVTFGLG